MDVLLVDLPYNSINSIFARFIISIQHAIRISIQVLCCELLLLACWYDLRKHKTIHFRMERKGREKKHTWEDEGSNETRVPGARPVASSFWRLYAARSGLIWSRSFLYLRLAACASSIRPKSAQHSDSEEKGETQTHHETQNLPS